MFTVQGLRDGGVPYAVAIHDEPDPNVGIVHGSDRMSAEIQLATGDLFNVPPTGDAIKLDPSDPWVVLQWLLATTHVTATTGNLPAAPDGWDVPADAIV